MENIKKIAAVVAILGAGLLVRGIVRNVSSPTTKGLIYSKEAFNGPCVSEATKGGNVSNAAATEYCGCVYDKGVAEYGAEQWSTELVNASDNGFTPKMNEFINSCLAQYKG